MHSIAEQFPIPAGKEAGMDHYAGMPNGGLCSASCMFVLLRHSKTERILNQSEEAAGLWLARPLDCT